MDDPPLARANNIELIRDVLAIMFHGDAFRACLLYYEQKTQLFALFFSFFFKLPAACVRHLPADVHRSSVCLAIVR